MTPASPLIIHCPHCNKEVAQPRIASGNTFGAVLWSDAKQEAPMLTHYPDLIRCPHCEGLFLASTATKSKNQPTGYTSSAPYPPELTEENWLDALDMDVLMGSHERYGRIGAWHAANAARRGKTNPTFDFSERAVHNLEMLGELFSQEDSANDLILRAEIARELKRFDESLSILMGIHDEELGSVVSQIQERAQSHDSSLFELKFD
ncbi:hypothetical protein IAD21_05762 [Abditibacteriota bacterium]|nr:hypothetical protein IAD21_05762 [Abditibacteriota bacterium]